MAANIPRPWWERLSVCAAKSPGGCRESFFTQLECVEEVGPNGERIKRCIRLRKRLLECDGKEPMVDEQKHEVTTYPDASDHSIDLDDDDEGFATLGTSPPTRIPEAAAVGQALEEVIRLAEDLQEGFAAQSAKSNAPPTPSTSASSPSVHLDHPPPQQHQQQQQAWMDPLTSRDINKETGLLSRLFKNRTRTPSMHSAASAASTSTPNGGSRHAPWSVYEKDFQDV